MVRVAACAGVLLTLTAAAARAQPSDATPPAMEGVGIDEQLNAALPLDAVFHDETGKALPLSELFTGSRPVILTLNYFQCPMLCGLQLDGLIDALKALNWTPGRQFDLLTVSFDPLEDSRLGRLEKQQYLSKLEQPGIGAGWRFLTGSKENIKRLTSAVGFRYRWNDETNQWAHPSALILCTPDGRISRYLGGVAYDPQTLRLSLVEASQGRIGSLFDQVFLTCFHYDSVAGKYAPMATGMMRAGGVITLVLLGLLLAVLWRRERRRRLPTAAMGNHHHPGVAT
jgi:protein SCO1/2